MGSGSSHGMTTPSLGQAGTGGLGVGVLSGSHCMTPLEELGTEGGASSARCPSSLFSE